MIEGPDVSRGGSGEVVTVQAAKPNQKSNAAALKSALSETGALDTLRARCPGNWRTIELRLAQRSGPVDTQIKGSTLIVNVPQAESAFQDFLRSLKPPPDKTVSFPVEPLTKAIAFSLTGGRLDMEHAAVRESVTALLAYMEGDVVSQTLRQRIFEQLRPTFPLITDSSMDPERFREALRQPTNSELGARMFVGVISRCLAKSSEGALETALNKCRTTMRKAIAAGEYDESTRLFEAAGRELSQALAVSWILSGTVADPKVVTVYEKITEGISRRGELEFEKCVRNFDIDGADRILLKVRNDCLALDLDRFARAANEFDPAGESRVPTTAYDRSKEIELVEQWTIKRSLLELMVELAQKPLAPGYVLPSVLFYEIPSCVSILRNPNLLWDPEWRDRFSAFVENAATLASKQAPGPGNMLEAVFEERHAADGNYVVNNTYYELLRLVYACRKNSVTPDGPSYASARPTLVALCANLMAGAYDEVQRRSMNSDAAPTQMILRGALVVGRIALLASEGVFKGHPKMSAILPGARIATIEGLQKAFDRYLEAGELKSALFALDSLSLVRQQSKDAAFNSAIIKRVRENVRQLHTLAIEFGEMSLSKISNCGELREGLSAYALVRGIHDYWKAQIPDFDPENLSGLSRRVGGWHNTLFGVVRSKQGPQWITEWVGEVKKELPAISALSHRTDPPTELQQTTASLFVSRTDSVLQALIDHNLIDDKMRGTVNTDVKAPYLEVRARLVAREFIERQLRF